MSSAHSLRGTKKSSAGAGNHEKSKPYRLFAHKMTAFPGELSESRHHFSFTDSSAFYLEIAFVEVSCI